MAAATTQDSSRTVRWPGRSGGAIVAGSGGKEKASWPEPGRKVPARSAGRRDRRRCAGRPRSRRRSRVVPPSAQRTCDARPPARRPTSRSVEPTTWPGPDSVVLGRHPPGSNSAPQVLAQQRVGGLAVALVERGEEDADRPPPPARSAEPGDQQQHRRPWPAASEHRAADSQHQQPLRRRGRAGVQLLGALVVEEAGRCSSAAHLQLRARGRSGVVAVGQPALGQRHRPRRAGPPARRAEHLDRVGLVGDAVEQLGQLVERAAPWPVPGGRRSPRRSP